MKQTIVIISILFILLISSCEKVEGDIKFKPLKVESSSIELTKDKKNQFKMYGQIPASGETVLYTFKVRDVGLSSDTSIYFVLLDDIAVNRVTVGVKPEYTEDQFTVYSGEWCEIIQHRTFPYSIEVKFEPNNSGVERKLTVMHTGPYLMLDIIFTQEAEV